MREQELVPAHQGVVRPGRTKNARRRPEPGLLGLQQLAGNAAVSQLIRHQRGRQVVRHPVQRTVVQACGGKCGGGGKCACQSQARDRDQPDVTVQRKPTYDTTHTCGLSETARIFSSWAVAVAKLVENLPALDFAMTGLHTPSLKTYLKKHFAAKTAKERKKVLKKILPRYHMILAKMGPGLAKVRCGGTDCDHGDYAYTGSGSSNSTIWLCNVQFSEKPILDLAATWIHELSHSLYDTDDNGYYSYSGSTKLGLDGSLNEADCYGNFMVDYT